MLVHSSQVGPKIIHTLPELVPTAASFKRASPRNHCSAGLVHMNICHMPVAVVNGSKPFPTPRAGFDEAFVLFGMP
jgi:hypothetical protein